MRNQGRDNETWLSDLRSNGARQRAALSDLRAILLRSLNAALDKSASVNDSFLEDTVQDSLMLILERPGSIRGSQQIPYVGHFDRCAQRAREIRTSLWWVLRFRRFSWQEIRRRPGSVASR